MRDLMGLKDIQYVKGEASFFEMPAYNIKAGKSWVKTGEWIHFVENEMLHWGFTISPFINGLFFHFTMRIEIYCLIP